MTICAEEYQTRLHKAWEHFIAHKPYDFSDVRPEVMASWRRSRNCKVDPLRVKPIVLREEDVNRRLEAGGRLIRAVRAYMERIRSIVADSGFYLMLCDREGVILDIMGDEDLIREGRSKSNLTVGANRSEAFAGANALGACLTLGRPVQFCGEEHYALPHKKYTCSAAPIFASDGTVAACLNFASLGLAMHIHTLGMVTCAADGISKSVNFTETEKGGNIVVRLEESKQVHKLVSKVGGFRAFFTFDDIIGGSLPLRQAIDLSRRAARSMSNILILGESGVGKELFAQSIHNAGDSARGPFVPINCGALPGGLIASELFGYEGGAFTGANKDGNPGKFELADGGSLFLDEIGDMPLDVQATLLRVIQTREIMRIGARYPKRVNVRVIAATNRDLFDAVANKTFREDLYYRLNVFIINIPPLRERQSDIPKLAEYFLNTASVHKSRRMRFSEDVYTLLRAYAWPGNIRELENVVERAVHIADESESILPEHLPPYIASAASFGRPVRALSEILHPFPPRRAVEGLAAGTPAAAAGDAGDAAKRRPQGRDLIMCALKETGGNVKKSAELLGVSRRTLYRKLELYGIDRSEFRRI
jgi:transcriptional regulator of acetoin/glycerol metabolism